MRFLECPQCSNLFKIVIRRRRSHASYRAAFVDSGDARNNINGGSARRDLRQTRHLAARPRWMLPRAAGIFAKRRDSSYYWCAL